MDRREQENTKRNNQCASKRSYSDEERRNGIARLLAEAYCSRLRKQGKLKKLKGLEQAALPPNTRYDFLRGPEWSAGTH